MKKIFSLFLISVLFLFNFISPNLAEARSYRTKSSDVHVKGYFRKDGTYVKPYYRSKPDGNVWNNYSCIDYVKCGTTTFPKAPSNNTKDTFKNNYQQNNSVKPQKMDNEVKIPENATLNYFGDDWICNKGYTRNYLKNSCDKVIVPSNASLNYFGDDWICNKGYTRNYLKNSCDKVIVPPNASLNYFGDDWVCNKGYEKDYLSNSCEEV